MAYQLGSFAHDITDFIANQSPLLTIPAPLAFWLFLNILDTFHLRAFALLFPQPGKLCPPYSYLPCSFILFSLPRSPNLKYQPHPLPFTMCLAGLMLNFFFFKSTVHSGLWYICWFTESRNFVFFYILSARNRANTLCWTHEKISKTVLLSLTNYVDI